MWCRGVVSDVVRGVVRRGVRGVVRGGWQHPMKVQVLTWSTFWAKRGSLYSEER